VRTLVYGAGSVALDPESVIIRRARRPCEHLRNRVRHRVPTVTGHHYFRIEIKLPKVIELTLRKMLYYGCKYWFWEKHSNADAIGLGLPLSNLGRSPSQYVYQE
jgi:hypothetical protein